MRIIVAAVALPLLLSACASTVVDVVTLPVKVAKTAVSETIDATTTTQKEADRKRGRKLRKEEERIGREARLAQERRRLEERRTQREARRNRG